MFPVQSGCDHWSESPGIGGRFILLERMELSDESEAYTPTCDWWAAVGSVAEKLSISRETLRLWVRRAETDEGAGLGSRPTSGPG
jgi:transposase-like protein